MDGPGNQIRQQRVVRDLYRAANQGGVIVIEFFVPGNPVPKGSASAFLHKQTGRVIVQQTNRAQQKPWASMIGYVATKAGCTPVSGHCFLTMHFTISRPKAHFRYGKHFTTLRPGAPLWHCTKRPGDLDKLIRCVLDALTGIAYIDDSQVAAIVATKKYGDLPGVKVVIENPADKMP